jgi:hypothetical protein
MNEIEVHVHSADGGQTKSIKIAEDASIGQLLERVQAAGAAIGEPGEDIILWVENKEAACRRHQKLHECGIKHGHHLHFHHREVLIIVNTREKKWKKPDISYEEVVILAFGSYSQDPNVIYTVTYSKGSDKKREGSLVRGQYVIVKQRMIFNVSQTNKS